MRNNRRPAPHGHRHLSEIEQDKVRSIPALRGRLLALTTQRERLASHLLGIMADISAVIIEIERRGEVAACADDLAEFLRFKAEKENTGDHFAEKLQPNSDDSRTAGAR